MPSAIWVKRYHIEVEKKIAAISQTKCIFVNENVWISLETSLKFATKVNNIPALSRIIASVGRRQAIIWSNAG